MAVNANSVISTWMNSWYPAFYNALTSQENDCYTRDANGFLKWNGFFISLNSALTSFKTANREPVLTQILQVLPGYLVIGNTYGTDLTQVASADALASVFTANGFTAACISRIVSYYNDIPPEWQANFAYTSGAKFIYVNTGTSTVTWYTVNSGYTSGSSFGTLDTQHCSIIAQSSPSISADITTINGYAAPETAVASALNTNMVAVLKKFGIQNSLQDMPISGSMTKLQAATYIFNTLHYKPTYQNLNTGTLTLPTGV